MALASLAHSLCRVPPPYAPGLVCVIGRVVTDTYLDRQASLSPSKAWALGVHLCRICMIQS